MNDTASTGAAGFDALGLAPALVKALAAAGLTRPTPIQTQAIPLAMHGHDVLGLAQTGTGKTLAFGLPLITQLLASPGRSAPKSAKALILAPTRELVNQIAESLRPLMAGTPLQIAIVVGGQSINRQIATLARGTDILVATPGRLIELMDTRAVDLGTVRFLVLDEADQMLDIGFIHALRKIAGRLGKPRQTMLFSATMPKQLEEISRSYLSDPKKVQVSPPGKAADKITQSVHFLQKAEKPARLREILARDPGALTLVFGRTKHGSEKLKKSLVADGFSADSIHGNKSQGQRDRAIKAFREGKVNVLVATDVAARGIDIPGVAYVINYELPEVPDTYVHRIGRTARAGREGEAIALCAPEEADLLHQIQKLMKTDIPVASGTSPLRSGAAPAKPAARTGAKPGGPAKGKSGHSGRPDTKPANSASGAEANGGPRRRRRPRRRVAA